MAVSARESFRRLAAGRRAERWGSGRAADNAAWAVGWRTIGSVHRSSPIASPSHAARQARTSARRRAGLSRRLSRGGQPRGQQSTADRTARAAHPHPVDRCDRTNGWHRSDPKARSASEAADAGILYPGNTASSPLQLDPETDDFSV